MFTCYMFDEINQNFENALGLKPAKDEIAQLIDRDFELNKRIQQMTEERRIIAERYAALKRQQFKGISA